MVSDEQTVNYNRLQGDTSLGFREVVLYQEVVDLAHERIMPSCVPAGDQSVPTLLAEHKCIGSTCYSSRFRRAGNSKRGVPLQCGHIIAD